MLRRVGVSAGLGQGKELGNACEGPHKDRSPRACVCVFRDDVIGVRV